MRYTTALVCFALLAALGLYLYDNPAPLQGQDTLQAEANRPADSLELGPAFDLRAQREFEQQLTPDERATLIQLRSRFTLADPECPLPTSEPTKPFYIKLKGDMTRGLADSLANAGATFLGYYNPHAHLVRAAGADSLKDIGVILREHPLVAGTAEQLTIDKLPPHAWQSMTASGDHSGEYTVLFWRSVNAEEGRKLLAKAGAWVIEGTRDEFGRIDLRTPIVTVGVNEPGFQLILQSHLVEHIEPRAPKVSTNQTSAVMSNADEATIGVNPYNLDGTGQIVGVWDEGPARDTHDNFQNAPGSSPINNGNKRVLKIDTTLGNGGGTGISNHGTHVTGTIIGDGNGDSQTHSGTGEPESRGYAYNAFCVSHNWDNVFSERRQSKHDWNHVADNHSWSSSGSWGGYNGNTQQFDFDNRDSWLCQIQSAGNYANNGGRPFSDSGMTIFSTNAHRNGGIIAAANDSEDIAGFSSRGPAADGRLIPQYAANGTGLRSCTAGGDSSYASYSGTSMSGPSVTGSVVLLSQLWRREHNGRMLAPDVMRAVLALTARDKFNTGPDYRFGFGIVDCQAASDLILADKQNGKQIVRGAIRSGATVEYEINVSSSNDPLRVVLSWLDLYGSTGANPVLVNDLDVELEEPGGTIHYPYSGVTSASDGDEDHVFTTTGPNTRDNIELVHVDSPATGTWILRVKGTSIPASPYNDIDNDVQGYVLASGHEIGAQQLKFEDSLNTGAPVSIPDDNATGITRSFSVSDPRVITGVRVITRIMHERRGDLEIELEHPGGTTVTLKTQDSGPEDDFTDVIGVFPDTRQPDDDITALMCLPVQGTWLVHVRDLASGNTGTLDYLALELDVRVNNAPVADAGSDFDVREENPGQLDASATADADGDPFTFAWVQTGGGITLNLSATDIADPTFTAPPVNQDEVVTFELTATDCSGANTVDTVQVTVLNNAAPVADAGSDIALIEGDSGQLDASGSSDPESDPLTYSWTQINGNIIVGLSATDVPDPSFTTPMVTQDETVEYEVTVTDDRGDFTTDTVILTVELNVAPVADAGATFALEHSEVGSLDATGSYDPNTGDVITYKWVQAGGENTVVLSDDTNPQPTFTAPNEDDKLKFDVTVTDIRGETSTARVVVWVNEDGKVPSSGGGGDSGGGGCSSGDQPAWLFALLLALVGGAFVLRRKPV